MSHSGQTAGLATLLALAGIEFSYDQTPEGLRNFRLFDMAQNTVRSESKRWASCNRHPKPI